MIDDEPEQAIAALLDVAPARDVSVGRALEAGRSAQAVPRMKGISSGARAAVAVSVGMLLSSCALVNTADVRPASDPSQSQSPSPSPSTGVTSSSEVVVDGVPVWYDAKGLHRGDVVEQTPVDIAAQGGVLGTMGALALVRSGALYWDPETLEVWFHPWGGKPHIVGHDSPLGPGGDPNGDTAAWFEKPGTTSVSGALFEERELVIYDTAAGREISRTLGLPGVQPLGGDHRPPGNTFLQVSAERVVWLGYYPHRNVIRGGEEVRLMPYSHDIRTNTTSPPVDALVDLHNDIEASDPANVDPSVPSALVLRVPGRDDQSYPNLEGGWARLNGRGSYLLAVEYGSGRHAAAIVDTGTGDLWQVPKNAYPNLAWSYGDIAMVDTEDELLACDATLRTCQSLPAERPFLMPTS